MAPSAVTTKSDLANFRYQIGRLGEHLEAGLDSRPGKRHQPETQSTRRASAGRDREIAAKRLGGDLGQAVRRQASALAKSSGRMPFWGP